jgi:pyruvate kinase
VQPPCITHPALARTLAPSPHTLAGSETTSAYLTVQQMEGDLSALCVVHNSCELEGIQLTVHIGNMKNEAPILAEGDKAMLEAFGRPNKIDFVALSFTRSAQDVRDARAHLDK